MTIDTQDDELDLNINQTADPADIAEIMRETAPEPKSAEPAPAGHEEEEDDGDDDDQRGKVDAELAAASTDAEREAIKAERRNSRGNQRQRAREKIATLERQLANSLASQHQVQERLAQLETTNLGTQYAQLQQAKQQVASAEQQLKDALADATVKGDGARAADATQALIQVQRQKEIVDDAMGRMETQARTPKTQPLDQEMVRHANEFMKEHRWYTGPKGADQDSRVLTAIDNAVQAEGFDPRTPVYWQEVRRRAGQYLSHRFSQGENNVSQDGVQSRNVDKMAEQEQRKTPRSPVPAGGSNNSSGGGNSQTYRLSAERVKAMKEAGYWDDPTRRASMIKRYQQIDRDSART